MAYIEKYANFDLVTGSNDGSSEVNAWQTITDVVNNYAAGDRVNIKKTTSAYQPGDDVTFVTNASLLSPIHLRGYGSTIGDGIMFEMDMQENVLTIDSSWCKIQHLSVTGTNIYQVVNIRNIGDGCQVINCEFYNTGVSENNHYALELNNGLAMCIRCETTGTGTGTAAINLDRSTLRASHIKSTRIGVYLVANGGANVKTTVVEGDGLNTVDGIVLNNLDDITSPVDIDSCTFYNFVNGINCINLPDIAESALPSIVNNVFYNCTNGVYNTITLTKQITIFFAGNGFGDITTSNYNGFGDNQSFYDYSINSDPFTDAVNGDFSLVTGSDPIAAGIDAGGCP